jgi:hypothetical protein
MYGPVRLCHVTKTYGEPHRVIAEFKGRIANKITFMREHSGRSNLSIFGDFF